MEKTGPGHHIVLSATPLLLGIGSPAAFFGPWRLVNLRIGMAVTQSIRRK
ncbi:hypothetical protein [Novosphingobium album (ex Liu et al. 2023)]|uniref:Uncharacterized protein n=1 Tax=Novosphingobium album (ex Liu et al. 2023) TaxID=3031130 RepID=A0ABT5WXW6_9SPHN|nr:hypothetical protein [Novosphingobium album (ex Liu et al. 2023)]MDE8654696.1 hypothetical protein [Novosphingobium album (ex Liu et al. 2023)]